ncbi:MAG: AAA domain-containing protein, partial [Thermoanaerobaculia bacterium]
QERVIRRLEETGAVLVQGPPGTGKSHTIANLIGHLLAQKKSILVTSHASKALRIVREHVAKPLQSLCVSVIYSDEESSKQLEESITGIVNYLATTSQRKLRKEIDQLVGKRASLKSRHAELRRTLLEAVTDEYRELEVAGERLSPSLAARKLVESQGVHDWVPGPLEADAELPLTDEELLDLYTLNAKITEEDEKLLTASLPDVAQLPAPKDFASLYDEINNLDRKNLKTGSEFWLHENHTRETLSELMETLTAAVEVLDVGDEWLLECFDAGRNATGEKDSWLALVRLIDECCRDIPPKEEVILSKGPRVKSSMPTNDLLRVCTEMIEHLKAGKKIKRLAKLLKPEWQQFIESCRVDEGPPTTLEHFEAIRHWLDVRAARDNLMHRWDRQMGSLDAPQSSELGRKPEKTAKQYAEKILLALNWHDEVWSGCLQAFQRAGLNWSRLENRFPVQRAAYGDIIRIRDIVLNQLKPIIETREEYLRWKSLCAQRDGWQTYLNGFSKKEASYPLIKLFKQGLRKTNYDAYNEAWQKLHELTDLREAFEQRRDLIKKLEATAPAWAHAARSRQAPHDGGKVPGDVEAAWRHRQWEQVLKKLDQVDLDGLQRQLNTVTEELHEVTALYVEKLAWLAQLERTGLKQQQALNGWLGLHKKMGKGTGKQVARLKEEAKKTLVECRQAVPVWIMPLSRVVESFDMATTRFDVVILDEASQSDVLGL